MCTGSEAGQLRSFFSHKKYAVFTFHSFARPATECAVDPEAFMAGPFYLLGVYETPYSLISRVQMFLHR